jgi:hypothetical protein
MMLESRYDEHSAGQRATNGRLEVRGMLSVCEWYKYIGIEFGLLELECDERWKVKSEYCGPTLT